MEKFKRVKPWYWALLIGVLVLAVVILVVSLNPTGEKDFNDKSDTTGGQENTEGLEMPAIPLPTKYIILSYPAELEDDVKVSYEELDDGQLISFTTNFAGEELDLFQFSISTSGDDGFPIGVLEDDEAGNLVVCVSVKEYVDGNFKPEDFNKLNAMQERVNDIIVQFYDDPRFVPNK